MQNTPQRLCLNYIKKDKLEACECQEIFSYSAFICLITNFLCVPSAKISSLILTEGEQENVSFKETKLEEKMKQT